jgi:hypothetical protein
MKINAGPSGFRKNSFEFKMRISIENDERGEEEVLLCFVIISTGSSLILWFILSFASNTFNAPKLIIINSRTTMFVHNFDWKKHWGI